MFWLFLGLALWAAVHLVPSTAPSLRMRLIDTLGAGPYKGLLVWSGPHLLTKFSCTPVSPAYRRYRGNGA